MEVGELLKKLFLDIQKLSVSNQQRFGTVHCNCTNISREAFFLSGSTSIFHILLSSGLKICNNDNINSMALVREQTMPTERPTLVGEVNAKVCG
jgi:hypothetical protein